MTRDGGKTWKRDPLPPNLEKPDDTTSELTLAGPNLYMLLSGGRLLVRPVDDSTSSRRRK